MSDVALYRKYRPQSFTDVIGQDHVVKVLQGAIEQKNISHAYLFCGSRGTGKTSLARIFASAVGTSANDLYEIDAASNRGIDDIRALRDSVNTLPFESAYKVYIVDEVHMLTKEAFNALLKTLEEPPKHVIFILATTESEKLPETVVSRCQQFTFKKPNQKTLKDVVISVAKEEGVKVDLPSAELIALLGDGSFRDTLGILQKVITSCASKKVELVDVETVTGAPRSGLVMGVVSAIIKKDLGVGLTAVNQAVESHVDMKIFLKLILQRMRFLLLLKFAPDMEVMIKDEVSEEDFAYLKKQSSEKTLPISSSTLVELLQAYEMIGFSALPQLPLELALTKIIGEGK